MPLVSQTYSGTYLNASELMPLGQRRCALIHGVTQELVGQTRDAKLVLSLVSAHGKPWPKEVVLNKGNALQLQAAYGDDTDGWGGRRIEIWAENVQFQGKVVPGIKVLPAPVQTAPVIHASAPAPAAGGNGAGQPAAPVQPTGGPAWDPPAGTGLDDEIPFAPCVQ